MNKYWEYLDWDDRLSNCQFKTKTEALEHAQDKWAEFCGRNSDFTTIDLIEFGFDKDENPVEVSREIARVYFEYEREEAPYLQSEL